MKLSEHKDLKVEILALPPKEKDKLLLRLVAKDKVLTEHLHFLLLENEINLSERVIAIKEEIKLVAQNLNTNKQLNAKDILLNMRKLTKLINHFFKVTKAQFEEVELKIFLLNNTTTVFKFRLFSSFKNYEHLFATYFLKSTLMVIKKFNKLHEDLQFDLKEDLNKVLITIYKDNMASLALDLNLPKKI